jgi:TetR/AcrR family transcriptional regulator
MPQAPSTAVRQRLLRAATRLFAARGYAATSIREIVEAAGVTKPAVYYHFASKEGLYRAILAEVELQLEALLASEHSSADLVRARVERLFLRLWTLFERKKEAVRFINAVFWGPRQGAPPTDFTLLQRAFNSALERLIQDGVASGELRPLDPGDAARALLALVAHSMDLALAYPRLSGGKAGLVRCLDLVFRGLAAPVQPRPETAP